mmetsp:Transcript_74398/g.231974  ORF Transcript_74398/g.231974 Transcript_74398/m.231974 type:complete len:509 (-) Transcript_74398:518-2044(-)
MLSGHVADDPAESSSIHHKGLRGWLPLLSVGLLAMLTACAAARSLSQRPSPGAPSPLRASAARAGATSRALSDPYWRLSSRLGSDGRFSLVPLPTAAAGRPTEAAADAAATTTNTPARTTWNEPLAEAVAPEEPQAALTEEADPPEPPAAPAEGGVAWTKEPKAYYSWMWADVAVRPAPLDLGHGGAEPEPTRWSPWLGREAAMEDLQLYRTSDNLGRPMEMRIAAARGNISKEKVEGSLMPGSKRFLSRFSSLDEAIDYLSRGGATLRGRWHDLANLTSEAPPASALATAGQLSQDVVGSAGGTRPTEETAGVLSAPASAAPSVADVGDDPGLNAASIIGYIGYLGFLPFLACIGWVGFRVLQRQESRDIVTSAGEEESSQESDDERGHCAPDPWQAFLGDPHDGELRRLLVFAEEGPLQFPPLPDDCDHGPPNPAQRGLAEAEVERILSTRDPREIFGPGDEASRKQEFRRLVRLLHPDKGLVSGERASLALRRVVEVYRSLAARV